MTTRHLRSVIRSKIRQEYLLILTRRKEWFVFAFVAAQSGAWPSAAVPKLTLRGLVHRTAKVDADQGPNDLEWVAFCLEFSREVGTMYFEEMSS